MIKSILQLGNETLRKRSISWDDFQNDDLASLIKDLSDTLHDAKQKFGYGHGIAAPQIDALKRVIFVDTEEFKGPLINPTVVWASDEKTEIWDSCFSFSVAFFVLVDRNRSITVEYYDQTGEKHLLTADDRLSELLQHEIDHLEGVLAMDRMKNRKTMMRSEWQKVHGVEPSSKAAVSRAAPKMTDDVRVKYLLDFGKTIRPRELFPVLVAEAASLIEENPFAFALAAVLDRGTKSEIIWTIPYYLQQKLGTLEPELFASKSNQELAEIFQSLPMKPRYINDAPATVKGLSRIVLSEHGGDVTKMWHNRTSRYVESVFQRIYGVGPGIASMVVLLLERCYGIRFTDLDHRNMDVKPDVHIIRVFSRLGFISQPNETEALKAARRLNPEYPGALDAPAWIIGKKWCAYTAPQCSRCPLTEVCPKNVA